MPRTVITPQVPSARAGAVLTSVAVDQTNGMQVAISPRTVVLVESSSPGAVTVVIPSVADQFGRTGDITNSTSVVANTRVTFGPFNPPSIWGDGLGNLLLNFSGLTGTVVIAAIEPL